MITSSSLLKKWNNLVRLYQIVTLLKREMTILFSYTTLIQLPLRKDEIIFNIPLIRLK